MKYECMTVFFLFGAYKMLNLSQHLKRQYVCCCSKFVFYPVKWDHCCLLTFDIVQMTTGMLQVTEGCWQQNCKYLPPLKGFFHSKIKIYDARVFWSCTEDKQSCWFWSQQSSVVVNLIDSSMVVPLT